MDEAIGLMHLAHFIWEYPNTTRASRFKEIGISSLENQFNVSNTKRNILKGI